MEPLDDFFSYDPKTLPYAITFFGRYYKFCIDTFQEPLPDLDPFDHFQFAKLLLIQTFLGYLIDEAKSPSPNSKIISGLSSMIVHIAQFDFDSYPPEINPSTI